VALRQLADLGVRRLGGLTMLRWFARLPIVAKAAIVVGALAVVAGGAYARAVKVLWQGSSAWGHVLLGRSTKTTISSGGCLLTCFTMALNSLRAKHLTPDVVNRMLVDAGDIVGPVTGRGPVFDGAMMVSDRAAVALGLQYFGRVVSRAAADLRPTVDEAFARNGLAILNVDHSGDGRPDHFALLVARDAGGYTAADPAPAELVRLDLGFRGRVDWNGVEKTYTPAGVFGLA
jgi:hypothetical protein